MGYCKEQNLILRERVRKVLISNPGITNNQLRARFGNKSGVFSDLRKELSKPCPRSEFVTVDDLKNAKYVDPNMAEHAKFGRSW